MRKMKVATYNIWNSSTGMPLREQYIINEIKNINADILCLQEVQNEKQAILIANECDYNYFFFEHYLDEHEGLCILSKRPFNESVSWIDHVNAVYGSVICEDKVIGIVNLHLPWESTLQRERQIVDIVTYVDKENFDYVLIAGDFNCSDSADVQRYLLGDCSLLCTEARPCWFDLALSYAETSNTVAESTLDFRNNPRFKGINTIEINQRFDRILLRNTYPNEFPIVMNSKTFGKQIYDDIHLSASDHYGVVVEMNFD